MRLDVPDSDHTVGLCVGTRMDNQGVSCWSQEWDSSQGAYIRKRSYYFQSVVVHKSRRGPDLTQADTLTCDGLDPMMGCWALETHTSYDGKTYFPAYRLLPKTNKRLLFGDAGFDIGDMVSLATFVKDGGNIKWTVHGEIAIGISGAVFGMGLLASTAVAAVSILSF